MLDSSICQAFWDKLDGVKTVFITAHVGPDGDGIGAILGMAHMLKKAVPSITVVDSVIAGKKPDVFSFLPGMDQVKSVETATDLQSNYDVAIAMDCGSLARLGPCQVYFESAGVSINLDHHITNDQFGQLNVIDVEAAATGQVVAELLQFKGLEPNAEAAACLYVSLLTDTGGFKYSNTDEQVFEWAKILTRCGADPEQIYRAVYEKHPWPQIALHAQGVLKTQMNDTKTIAWTVITRQMLADCGALDEHLEGLVERIRQIDTVLIACLVKERTEGGSKISLRSDTHAIDVAAILAEFGGGGHKMAAGAVLSMKPDEALSVLLPKLEGAIKKAQPLLV